jgi:ribosomal protein S18 acetylase RimI-like enzyme
LLKDGNAIAQPPVVLPFSEAIARIQAFGACAVAGSGAALARESLGGGFVFSSHSQPDALWVSRLAAQMPEPKDAPGPLYLRAPDAKLPGGGASGRAMSRRPCDPLENPLFDVAPWNASADTAPLAALHAACFARAWDAATLSDMLAGPGAFAFAHDDGFVLGRTAADEAEILTLAVAPRARGKGLGRA